jgi:chromosomal replication initiator protein
VSEVAELSLDCSSTPVDVAVDNVEHTQLATDKPDADHLWERVAARLRHELADAVWTMWFGNVRALRVEGGTLVLGVPSSFAMERIRSSYAGLLHDTLRDATGQEIAIDLEIDTAPRDDDPVVHALPTANPPPGASAAPAFAPSVATSPMIGGALEPEPITVAPADPASLTAPGTLNERYTFDRFVIGTSNRFAHAAALSVAESPARSYNPLFIYGPAGLGKTHLLHAIGNYVKDVSKLRRVRYVSTEAFMNEFVEAIRTNTTPAFRRRNREVDVLLIDDIQFLERSQQLQEEFFHTFNTLHEAANQIVICSDRPPKAISTLEDRLLTRFEWGLITDIHPPEFETRLAILRMKAEAEQLGGIPDDVLAFIAGNIADNVRKLEGALIRVAAYSSLNRTPLSEEVARHVLADLLPPATPRIVTPRLILDETAKMFGFTVDELCGKSRRRPLVMARQIGMYVFRELTDYSYPKIAEEFGGRDHTTVMHAVEKVKSLMTERHTIFDQVNELIGRIRLGTGG